MATIYTSFGEAAQVVEKRRGKTTPQNRTKWVRQTAYPNAGDLQAFLVWYGLKLPKGLGAFITAWEATKGANHVCVGFMVLEFAQGAIILRHNKHSDYRYI